MQTGLMWHSYATGPCASEIINSIVLLYSLAFITGAVITLAAGSSFAMTATLGVATLFSLPSFWTLMTLRSTVVKKEGFQAGAAAPAVPAAAATPQGIYHVIGSAAPASNTLPTARNPFMNVLLDEIKYNPARPVATSVLDPSVKVTLDDFFRTEFTADPTDVFGRSQSQRQFVTMPSTSIPNDRESYQNWLYKIPGKTCKEGGRESCLPGTDGGALPWMNN